eukprot:2008518-Rhodomonas_salina.2
MPFCSTGIACAAPTPIAVCGTGIYSLPHRYWHMLVLASAMTLRASYAVSGRGSRHSTAQASPGTLLRAHYTNPGTDIAYYLLIGTGMLSAYAKPGTDIRTVSYGYGIAHGASTEIAHGVLPGVGRRQRGDVPGLAASINGCTAAATGGERFCAVCGGIAACFGDIDA